MPAKDRTKTISVRLSDDEVELREALETHFGTDGASIMRMALLELGRAEAFEFPLKKKERTHPKA
jgi:hypothetical protein